MANTVGLKLAAQRIARLATQNKTIHVVDRLSVNLRLGLGPYETADCPPGYYIDGTMCTFKLFTTPSSQWFSKFGVKHSTDMKNCEAKHGVGNCEAVGVSSSRKALRKCSLQAKDKGYANWEHWGQMMVAPVLFARDGDSSVLRTRQCVLLTMTSLANTGILCYIDCEKEYGKGYYNNGTSCFLDVDTKQCNELQTS